MRNVRMLGLALFAVFALGATAAASAFAEEAPQLVTCNVAAKETVIVNGKNKSVYTGKYTESKCDKLAPAGKYRAGKAPEGKYELGSPLPNNEEVSVTGTSKATKITAYGASGKKQVIACTKDKFAGVVFNHNGTIKIEPGTFTFEECESNKLATDKCGNVAASTIEYTTAFGESAWLAAGETTAGMLLVAGPTFSCGGETVEIGGVLIGALENSAKTVNITWKTASAHQAHQSFFSAGVEETGYHWSSEPGEREATVVGKEELKLPTDLGVHQG